VTRFVGTPLRGVEFGSPSDEAVSSRVAGDTVPRLRIDAGGRITWSTGSATGDTKLYRSDSSTLLTEGIFSASGGLVTLATSGSPTISLPDGAIAVDTVNNAFYFRSSGAWSQVTAGAGNAAINVSDTAPVSPEEGDLWFNSLEATTYIYYDGYWIDIAGATASFPQLRQLADVDADVLVNGDVPVYKQSTDQFVVMPIWEANPVITTTLSSSVSTAIGQFSTTYFTTGEFFVQITQGSKTTACKIMAAHNGSVADFTEYGTVEIGSPAIPVSFTVVLDEGNLKLKASISDAASTNATVKVSKTVVGGL
jgi:hypothetical protein